MLKRKIGTLRLTCATSLLVLVAATLAAGFDDETPTIKDVMQKLHRGKSSPLAKLKTALKSDSPDWKAIQKTTKEFEKFGAALPKNDPPKGSKAAYTKLADRYYASAKALNEAALKEEKAEAQAALTKISTSCAACHKAHRED
jgi:hypothetical protein